MFCGFCQSAWHHSAGQTSTHIPQLIQGPVFAAETSSFVRQRSADAVFVVGTSRSKIPKPIIGPPEMIFAGSCLKAARFFDQFVIIGTDADTEITRISDRISRYGYDPVHQWFIFPVLLRRSHRLYLHYSQYSLHPMAAYRS